MSTVLCLGEVMVDLIRNAVTDTNKDGRFENHPAGVAANVAVGLARQGINAGLIARVGYDSWGRWAVNCIADEGVDTSFVRFDTRAATRVATVERLGNGERRSLHVTMSCCADSKLAPADVDPSQFKQARVLYFGSTVFSQPTVARATAAAIALARSNNLLVVSDSNIWPAMWQDTEICRQTVLESLKDIDVLKLSQSELVFLTGSSGPEAAEKLRQERQLPVLLVTLAEQGSWLFCKDGRTLVPAFPVQMKEAAGAGDGFVAGVIVALLPILKGETSRRSQIERMTVAQLLPAVKRANACGALVASKLGAMGAMPRAAEVQAFLEKNGEPVCR